MPATFKVTTFTDVVAADGLTSLREAIDQAAVNPGGDTIQLPAGEYDLSLGQLSISDLTGAVTIKGLGGAGATIDAQGKNRVIEISSVSTAEFRNLTLTGGSIAGNGGGIFNNGGTLTLQSCTVSRNQATSVGGGIHNNGGVLTLQSSTVSGNTAADDGGGILAGTVTLQRCTVSDNHAGGDGGGIYVLFTLNLIDSTVSGNIAVGDGDDIRAP